MDDALYQDAFVLRVDEDGERELTGFVGGPAGVAEIELDDSTRLAVDFAEPSTLATLRTDRSADMRLLVSLVGKQTAIRLVNEPPSTQARRVGQRRRLGPSNTSMDFLRTEHTERMGRAAVLASLAGDNRLHELVRGSAALELAQLAPTLHLSSTHTERLTDQWVGRATSLLEAGSDGFIVVAGLDPSAIDELRRLLSSIASTQPTAVSRLLRQLQDALERANPAPAATPATALDELSASSDEQTGGTLFELRPAGRLIVHHSAGPEDHPGWVRVVARDALVVLAVAPFEPVGTRWRAEAIVPPDLYADQIRIDVTPDPFPVRTSLDAVRRAVALGREAASYEVIADRRATQAWQRCANAWQDLGDPRRAALARQRIAQRRASRDATLTDRLRGVLVA